MKIKEGYILRAVAGNNIVVSVGDLDFNGMITLNDSGTMLWKALATGSERKALIALLLETYEVDEPTAAADVDAFLAKLTEAGILE